MRNNKLLNRFLSLIIALSCVFSAISCTNTTSQSGSESITSESIAKESESENIIKESESESYYTGESESDDEKQSESIVVYPQEQAEIKNVIYLIADGLSSSTLNLARDLKGDSLYLDEIMVGQEMVITANLSTLKEPNQSESWKISYTDSSSCGTALASGRKTYKNGQGLVIHNNDNGLAYANDGVKTDWENGETERIKSILTLAGEQGKKTAVITTADILDATPSAFYSHSERGYWDTVYADLKKSGIDVLVGTNSYAGNTLANWKNDFSSLGYETVDSTDIGDFNKVTVGEKFISIADSGNGNHDPLWDYNTYKNGNIRIFDYFSKTLDLFDAEDEGFFIMVEGGEIDIGGHNDEAQHAFSEIYAFDETIKQAIDYASLRDDTIVVVSVDHGNSQFKYNSANALQSFDFTWSEQSFFYNRFDAFTAWVKSNISKNYDGHTLEDVMLATYLPEGVDNPFEGKSKIQNIEIPRFIAQLLNIDIDKENRIYNGLEVEETFGYEIIDFNDSLKVGKDDAVSAISYWAPYTSGCGFVRASEQSFNDREKVICQTKCNTF